MTDLQLTRAQAIQQARELGYSARTILILPPSLDILEERLRKAEKDDDAVQEALAQAAPYFEADSKLKEEFDAILTNQEPDATFKAFEGHVYGTSEATLTNGKLEDETMEEADETMVDVASEELQASQAPQASQEAQEPQESKENEVVAESTEPMEVTQTEEAGETKGTPEAS